MNSFFTYVKIEKKMYYTVSKVASSFRNFYVIKLSLYLQDETYYFGVRNRLRYVSKEICENRKRQQEIMLLVAVSVCSHLSKSFLEVTS